jgi:acylphosphatase
MNARASLYIDGRVQGVNFRGFTRRLAQELGLKGWVRNLYDGRVEALAEGERAKIETFIERLRIGPPLARVERVDVRWADYTGEFPDFRIGWTDF